ncbi:MAG: thioredoxin family protein [Verrucomicrobiota bacterium]
MTAASKKTVWIMLACALAGAWATTSGKREGTGAGCPALLSVNALAAEAAGGVTNAPAKAKRPRLVDLGADKCIPCKMMAPVLNELKKEYEGRMEVEFIDVWKNADAGKAYKLNLIPTQIFFNAAGKELFRHEGFFSKKDILAKWKELGVDLKGKGGSEKALPAKG